MTQTAAKVDILSLLPGELEAFLLGIGQPKYRAAQIFTALSRGKNIDEISTLPLALRAELAHACEFRMPKVAQKLISKLDGTEKYMLEFIDGECVESVLMRYKHGNTLCVSTQAGCRMGCSFCACTIGGRVRDLKASEIYGQVTAAVKESGERISNIVMMGIGEPLDNYDNSIKFMHLVNAREGLNIGYRHISLSTCGIADKITRLANEDMPITLSISLHASNDIERDKIMPVNKKWNLSKLLFACREYYIKSGWRISFEYTLIKGKNDSAKDADSLANLLNDNFYGTGAPLYVNLICVNEVKETGFEPSSNENVNSFCAKLKQNGINATIRRKLGADINAACGQLRSKGISNAQ